MRISRCAVVAARPFTEWLGDVPCANDCDIACCLGVGLLLMDYTKKVLTKHKPFDTIKVTLKATRQKPEVRSYLKKTTLLSLNGHIIN